MKEEAFSNVLISQNLNLRDIILKTINFKFKCKLHQIEEDTRFFSREAQMIEKELTFYRDNSMFLNDILALTEECEQAEKQFNSMTHEVESTTDHLVWENDEVRSN